MHTEINPNAAPADTMRISADITPDMINEIYQEANRLRAEAMHNGVVAACRALRRAITAIGRTVFTSEARRHA